MSKNTLIILARFLAKVPVCVTYICKQFNLKNSVTKNTSKCEFNAGLIQHKDHI